MIHPKVKAATSVAAVASAVLAVVAALTGFAPDAAQLTAIGAVETLVVFAAGYLAPGYVTE